LFYLVTAGVDATMMSVRVERGATWTANTPSKLFAGRFFFRDTPGSTGQGRTFDVSPDGQRFLMLQAGTDTSQPRFIFVQNFVEQLKRLVPTN
jgi:hypothetical protein